MTVSNESKKPNLEELLKEYENTLSALYDKMKVHMEKARLFGAGSQGSQNLHEKPLENKNKPFVISSYNQPGQGSKRNATSHKGEPAPDHHPSKPILPKNKK